MIYTCYDMIRDCRADRAQGWSYLVSRYVPVIRRLLAHYFPTRGGEVGLIDRALEALRRPDSSLFASMEPAPERWFVAELRQRVLAAIESETGAEGELDLEALQVALEPLTLVEKQAAWMETMGYRPVETGVLLRMDPRTVEKIRDKAADRIRAAMDSWRRSLMAENGRRLGRAAASARTADCLPAKAFLDVLDGRTTWRGREEMERHVSGCWHCIDHFCRIVEVKELLRGMTSLSEEEARPFNQALGIAPKPKPARKGWFSRA